MSRKADCWDKARTERVWGYLKRACVYGRQLRTGAEAIEAVMNWLAFYSARRLHSTLGYVSPLHL